ncbi:MAG: hypothetical protein ACERJ1_15525 [Halodesulfovibrio sp.]|uniref:hypothetical protein n=1 Tax=Halodesulfovibrio sp. TaxID=1912772 RepID=UPI00359DCF94
MIKFKKKHVLMVCIILVGCSILSFTNIIQFSPKEYVVIKGKKPVDAEIFGYLRSSDTNELCLKENWLSGTKYLSSYDDELEFITYSDEGDSYSIKVPLVPESSSKECDTKVHTVQIAFNSPGAKTQFAELKIRVTQPDDFLPGPDMSDSLYVKSLCQSYKYPDDDTWSEYVRCDYYNGDKVIAKKEGNGESVTLSPDLFKAGTVITYDIIPGENYFPTLDRPE